MQVIHEKRFDKRKEMVFNSGILVMGKDKTLTTKFDLQTMAEFSVAVEILGARSINALVHQMVKQKIREAKGMISSEEFAEMVEAQKEKTLKRSEMKIKEHQNRVEILGKIDPTAKGTLPMFEIDLNDKKKKSS